MRVRIVRIRLCLTWWGARRLPLWRLLDADETLDASMAADVAAATAVAATAVAAVAVAVATTAASAAATSTGTTSTAATAAMSSPRALHHPTTPE